MSGFWEATLTPNTRVANTSILVGYRRAGVTIPDFTHESAGAGTLAPDTMSLRGVEYTVDALAVVSVSGSGWNVGLRTDPLLPRGQDLWLELGHVDGSTAVFAIDTASVEAPGYLWRAVYAEEDRHGWGTDSADVDTEIDSVTVRLATGAPTITGTAQVGQTLTAVTTGITDAEGLTSATYTYQWIQVNGTAADIAGENSSTYTLVDADLGKAIKVKVSFTDDASNAETRTSAATATVTAAATTTTQTLVSNTGRGNAGNRPVAANQYAQPFDTGTNSAGYNLAGIALDFQAAPSGSGTLTVTVRETSSGGPSGTALYTLTNPIFSDGSNEFLAPPNAELNANTQYWVMVSHSADSGGPLWYRTLLSNGVDTGAAAGWAIDTTSSFKSRSQTAWTASTGSSGNRAFQIDVKGSAKTGTVTNTAPTVATAILDQTATAGTVFIFNVPEDTFTDADSDTLTYSATQSDGSALPAWLSFDAAVPGFSGLPQAADVETVSVKLTASDGNGGSVSDTFDIVVSADTTVNCAGMCLVSNIGQTPENVQGFTNTDYAQSFTTGTNATGYTLTSIELKLSSSSGVATTPTVKLFRVSANGTEVATLIGATMLDENITKDYAFTPSSTVNLLTSTTYWVVAEGVSGVSWTNTAATSEDATPAAGWGIGDLYETRSASSTGGFTTTSTTALQIRVNGTLGSTTVTNNPPTVANAIQDQTATVGTALSFAFPATTFNDADSDTLTYTATQSDDSALPAWLSFDAATRTFSGTPQTADVETVSVKVTASDGNLSVSDTFDIVVSAAANNAAMGAPTITGTAQVGETLTAVTTGITDADGLTSVTYTYQWIRANGTEADITSENSSTYILVAADLGKTIKVKVSFTDDASNDETLTSAATATVTAAPTAPMVTDVDVTSMPASDDTYGTGEMIRYTVTFDQAVTVTGAPQFEFCLGNSGGGSCEVGTPPPTRRRALLSSGSGTTMLVFSYTVVEGDMDDNGIWAGDQDRTIKLEGGTIQGTVGGLDAVLTHTVVDTKADHKVNGAAANTAAMGAPTITGTAQVGETLTAATTGITDADGLTSVTYTYQWIRANGTEADIASANSSTYILIAADLGKTIKVKVDFTDDASNAETLTSAATATVVAAPTAPMVSTVVVTSSPDSGDTYGTGEMILFTVTFDQSVTVTGAPEFEFCLGMTATMSCDAGTTPPARRRAALSSGSGTTALVFGYTVVAGDVDDNGIWIGDQSRTIKLEGGTIQGTVGGLDAVLTHAEEGEQADHKVNGAAANTAPTAAHNTVTTGEDRAYTFTAADFGFMDADAGAALASVKIVTVPGAGTLALDGTAVMAADVVTEAQIDADMLTFRPAQDAHGAPYTTFTFKVNDGTDDSASAYTMTIDVTDAPAPVCTAPSFGDRREIWSGTVTVGRIEFLGFVSYGFDEEHSAGTLLPSQSFFIGSNNYVIDAFVVISGSMDLHGIFP